MPQAPIIPHPSTAVNRGKHLENKLARCKVRVRFTDIMVYMATEDFKMELTRFNMFNKFMTIDLKLCLRAQRQAAAAFAWALLHHIPVSIWEQRND